jgi:hypothetical protein
MCVPDYISGMTKLIPLHSVCENLHNLAPSFRALTLFEGGFVILIAKI